MDWQNIMNLRSGQVLILVLWEDIKYVRFGQGNNM
jgi:hypothetical protein